MEEKTLNKIITIPNALSLFRIALIPTITWAYFNATKGVCASIVALSFLTDVLDGYIARTFNMVSALGKALDPVADKLTLLCLLLCISVEKPLLYALVGIFLIKEITMGLQGVILYKLTGQTYSAKWFGKVTTGLLYGTSFLLIAFNNVHVFVINLAFYSCVLFNLLSLLLYSRMNIKKIGQIAGDERAN